MRTGATLLECLVVVAILSAAAVCALRVAGEGRVMRSAARDRAQMALIAQSELDRVRLLPAAKLAPGVQTRHSEDWPSGVETTTRLERLKSGDWLVVARVVRPSAEGKPAVELATVRPAGPNGPGRPAGPVGPVRPSGPAGPFGPGRAP